MIYDPRRRVYIRDDGSIVSPAELRKMIEGYIDREKQEVDSEAQKLLAGTITAAVFFDWFRAKIREVHSAAGMVAYGGEDQMNPERWGRIGERVASEVAYANQFEKDFQASEKAAQAIIAEVADALPVSASVVETIIKSTPGSELPAEAAATLDLSVESTVVKEAFKQAATAERIAELIYGETPSRAAMYMDAIYGQYENSTADRESDAGVISGRRVCEDDPNSCDGCVLAATDDFIPLDEILDIGGAECLSNCRCTIEFDYSGVGPLTISRDIYAPSFTNVNA